MEIYDELYPKNNDVHHSIRLEKLSCLVKNRGSVSTLLGGVYDFLWL